ncbi:MAG: GntR family transcriptional regulator [Victivallaceae bacterium]
MVKSETKFVYEQIAWDLRNRIRRNDFAENRLPAERSLAEHYNANRITLRKAIGLLEKDNLVTRDSTRGTIIGRRTRIGLENMIIGFVLVGRTRLDPLHSISVMELEQQLKAYKSNSMIFSISGEDEIDKVLVPAIGRKLVDGLIITGLTSPEIAEKIKQLNIPTVLLGHLMYASPIENQFDRVYPDSTEYSYQAVRCLLQEGYKRIALINGPPYQWLMNIHQGYMRALHEFKIPYEDALVERCDDETSVAAMGAMGRLLKKTPPDAVFVASERMLPGVMETLNTYAVKYPEDMGIISVGVEHSEHLNNKFVKFVACDWHAMVKSALKFLFARLGNPDIAPNLATVPFHIVNHQK